MVPRETLSFVFPRVPMFPRDEVEANIRTRRKTKPTEFPEGPYIKCFVVYLDFPLYNHLAKTNKQRRPTSSFAIVNQVDLSTC